MLSTDVLAVRWWWLSERQLVLVCQLVKSVACFNLLVANHRLKISEEA